MNLPDIPLCLWCLCVCSGSVSIQWSMIHVFFQSLKSSPLSLSCNIFRIKCIPLPTDKIVQNPRKLKTGVLLVSIVYLYISITILSVIDTSSTCIKRGFYKYFIHLLFLMSSVPFSDFQVI